MNHQFMISSTVLPLVESSMVSFGPPIHQQNIQHQYDDTVSQSFLSEDEMPPRKRARISDFTHPIDPSSSIESCPSSSDMDVQEDIVMQQESPRMGEEGWLKWMLEGVVVHEESKITQQERMDAYDHMLDQMLKNGSPREQEARQKMLNEPCMAEIRGRYWYRYTYYPERESSDW
jgi:hypothetical protein